MSRRGDYLYGGMGFRHDTKDHKRKETTYTKVFEEPILRGPIGFPWIVDHLSFSKSADSLAFAQQENAYDACYAKRRISVYAGYARVLGLRLRVRRKTFSEICKLTKINFACGCEQWKEIAEEHRHFLIFLGELHKVVQRVLEANEIIHGDLREWNPWIVGAALDEKNVPQTNVRNIYLELWSNEMPVMPKQRFIDSWKTQHDEQVNQLNSKLKVAIKQNKRGY
jgi:hypothetical protein